MSTYSEHDNKEIGSYFSIDPEYLEKVDEKANSIIDGDFTLYSTCRSAIKYVLDTIIGNVKRALLPAFTCHAVVEPFVKSGFEVYPYQINKDLSINVESLNFMVNDLKPNVILVHDYFGFDSNDLLKNTGLLEIYRKNGIVVIEDLTQSMFSGYNHIIADYMVGSIRKWMGIPDGAFIKGPSVKEYTNQDYELSEAKKRAMLYKHDYLTKNKGDKAVLLSLYKAAEEILDAHSETYGMSELSKGLFSLYDIRELCSFRRRNARTLLEVLRELENIVLPFTTVAEDETPFYVPVMVKKNRKELQQFLAKNGVFATVIWGCPQEFVGRINENSKGVYEEILCVPCDQRYTVSDMIFIGELFADFERR
jgi:dTDP-4-amino-4,6-dideoxygalactose transaminase